MIVSGGIDLAVGSTCALAVVGLLQGVTIAWLRLPAFIVTLAGLTGICGLVLLITHEGSDVPQVLGSEVFEVLGTGNRVWIAVVLFSVGWWVLNRTAFGQTAHAVGGNAQAAEPSGLPVRRTTATGGVARLFVIQGLVVRGANLSSYVQQVVSGGFLPVVVILQAIVSRRSGRAA